MAILHGRERPHQPSRPAAATQPGQHIVPGLAALAGHHADRPWQGCPAQALLWLEQPVGGELFAQPLELDEQVALARDSQLADDEDERRRGSCASGELVAYDRY